MVVIDILKDIFTNPVLLMPIIAWFVAQVLKVFINLLVHKKFDITRLFGDGGMPSGHSATVTTLAVVTGWGYGFGSIYFAMCCIFAVIVMHDASGVRQEAGKHAVSIKRISDVINEMLLSKDEEIRTEKLKELVGHTHLQVLCGALLGVVVSVVAMIIARVPYIGLA